MRATIWHNPKCSTSRKALALLQEAGAEVEIVEYLKHPPTRAKLAALYKSAGLSPRQGLRTKEADAKPLLQASDGAILDAMVANPILIERPLVETGKGVRLGRPIERIREIL